MYFVIKCNKCCITGNYNLNITNCIVVLTYLEVWMFWNSAEQKLMYDAKINPFFTQNNDFGQIIAIRKPTFLDNWFSWFSSVVARIIISKRARVRFPTAISALCLC